MNLQESKLNNSINEEIKKYRKKMGKMMESMQKVLQINTIIKNQVQGNYTNLFRVIFFDRISKRKNIGKN